MTPREEAIADCKYGLSLGMSTLEAHFQNWTGLGTSPSVLSKEEDKYRVAIFEIKRKLHTTECLLTN